MKKECLGLIDSLDECEKILLKMTKTADRESGFLLLAEMQQAAIEVGTKIEKQEGAEAPAVVMLEEYCEHLYQCFLDEEMSVVQAKRKEREKLLKQIRKNIQEAVREIREIVFFPYKASMWDSLESVWRAAAEREDCRVFVVPIPYYDKNPDGSFGQMRYEGTLFPEYVPVFDWRDYCVEKRKPDIIFIHNPYDNHNFVTSVHPNFYAERLSQYTDHLVYIPYCSGGGGVGVSEGLCVNPGTIYADHVIAESEAALKCYQRYFKEFVQRQNLGKIFTEKRMNEKFMLLGSPKIDKAIHCEREEHNLPEQWRRLIGDRKAVLYNTSIGGLLAGNEQALKKIENVLDLFARRKDVVLWWRPHPLSIATFASMRPDLLGWYQDIVDRYQKENFGIYDDTPDLYRAIAYTDMYYGDVSSIIHLYGVQGKPILQQNLNLLLNGREGETLCFFDYVREDKRLFALEAFGNGIFEVNLESGESKKLGALPDRANPMSSLYRRIYREGDNLWMVPRRGTNLFRYCLKDNRCTPFTLPALEEGRGVRLQYSCLEAKNLYIITGGYTHLITLDLQAGSSKTETLRWPKHSEWETAPCWFDLGAAMCKVGQCLYFTIYHTNLLAEYDLRTKKTQLFPIGGDSNQYSHILYDGTDFWLIPYLSECGTTARWNKETCQTWEIKNYPKEFQKSGCWFRSACFCKGALWLFPGVGNMGFRIDKTAMQLTPVDVGRAGQQTHFAEAVGDMVVLNHYYEGNTRRNTLVRLDADGNRVDEQEIAAPDAQQPSEPDMAPIYHSAFAMPEEYMLYESEYIHIGRLMDRLAEGDTISGSEQECFREMYANGDGSAGEKILNQILDLVGDQ